MAKVRFMGVWVVVLAAVFAVSLLIVTFSAPSVEA
jgi:hypothetical protein